MIEQSKIQNRKSKWLGDSAERAGAGGQGGSVSREAKVVSQTILDSWSQTHEQNASVSILGFNPQPIEILMS
jgi:hypothetical protein